MDKKVVKPSLVPTSQAAGNMTASNEEAMTAPGGQPVDNLNPELSPVQEDPELDEIAYDGRHLERGEGGRQGSAQWRTANSNPSWGP